MASSIEHLQCYLVGGAVRDELLVDQPGPRLGCCYRAAVAGPRFRARGQRLPSIFTSTNEEEHALARTERKRGHRGFVADARPDVTLEQDLRRRDLTINAIAKTSEVHH